MKFSAPAELPVRSADLAAYRNYHIVTLRSTAGVAVFCTPDLLGCSISVSGYYHGHIKGLLGNGNNEPFDDFTQANGKIVASESDFANSYKIGSCGAVQAKSHQDQENPTCSKLFGWESSLRYLLLFFAVTTSSWKELQALLSKTLCFWYSSSNIVITFRYCYPFVPTENYKIACTHGLAAGVKDTEEAIAKAYVAACNQRNIPIRVPAELGK